MVRGGFAGTALGTLAWALTMVALSFMDGFERPQDNPVDVLLIVVSTALTTGPGAFVLGLLLAAPLEEAAQRGTSCSRLLVAGAASGIPLGLINLGFAAWLGSGRFPPGPIHWVFVIPAVVGGIALGLGAALAVGRPRC